MKRVAALLICLLLTASACPARAGELSPTQREEADAFFARQFDRADAVGGAVIVNQGGERMYEYYFGRTGHGKVTDETVYKIASITKMITAIGVMQLVEQGKLSLDAPIVYGDTPVQNPAFPGRPITLRQVMSHTSSILPTANYTATPKWAKSDFDPKSAPGTAYTYANLNGGILGSLIERASGQSLNTYMREHVFAPLGINAAYAATLLPDSEQLSYSFNADGTVNNSTAAYLRTDAAEYEDTCDPDHHFRASVGGLYISLKGMEALGAALANGGRYQGVQLLSPVSLRIMRKDQSTLPGSSVTGESPYGLNTYRYPLDGILWYGHQGWWDGRLADLFYEPDSHTVVVLVMNGMNRSVGTVDRAVAAQMERTLHYFSPWITVEEDAFVVVEDE